MRSRSIRAAVVGLSLLLMACSSGPDPNAKKVKIEAMGAAGPTLSGTVTAGAMPPRNLDIKVPGSVEFDGIPTQYTIVFNGIPKGVTFKVSVDGKELKRGGELIVEDDKGPRATFEVAK